MSDVSRSILFTHAAPVEYSTVDTHSVSLPKTQSIDRTQVFPLCCCVKKLPGFQTSPAPHTTAPLSLQSSLESAYCTVTPNMHSFPCRKGGGSGGDGGGGGRGGTKSSEKSFPRWRASRKRKMDVLQSGIINNTVSSECRGEQWHCVEKRWRILLSFFSQTALSINYFYVFIHYFIPSQCPEWFLIAHGDAGHHVSLNTVFRCNTFVSYSHWSVGGHRQLKASNTLTEVLCLSRVLSYFAGVFAFYATF